MRIAKRWECVERFLSEIEAQWKPHPGQRIFLTEPAKVKVLACGRRWGKTEACAVHLAYRLKRGPPARHMIVAPTQDQAKILFQRLVDFLEKLGEALKPRWAPYPRLELEGHEVVARSAHVPRSLRGYEADTIMVDEAAFVPEAVITEVLWPMMATTDGTMILIGTPCGHNAFWRWFEMGRKGEHGIWSRTAPSQENPAVSERFLAVQRELVSSRAYAVEYEAQFIDDVGAVFRSDWVEQCLVTELGPWMGDTYIGVDWGRYEDFTAVVVLNGNRDFVQLLELDRFNKQSWEVMIGRVARLVQRYPGATVLTDGTGSGDPVLERLQARLPHSPIRGFTFNSASKAGLIDGLANLIERGALRMRPDPILLRELSAFRAVESTSGKLRYSGTTDEHDDLVAALALAAYQLGGGHGGLIQAGDERSFGAKE